MILFYSGAAGTIYDHCPEQCLDHATVMLSYFVHVNTKSNKPVERMRKLLKRRVKAKRKKP